MTYDEKQFVVKDLMYDLSRQDDVEFEGDGDWFIIRRNIAGYFEICGALGLVIVPSCNALGVRAFLLKFKEVVQY